MSQLLKLSLIIVLVQFVFMNQTRKIDFRGTFSAFTLKINKLSPAYAALVDTFEDGKVQEETFPQEIKYELTTDGPSIEPFIVIDKEVLEEEVVIAKQKYESLKGLKLAVASPVAPLVVERVPLHAHSEPSSLKQKIEELSQKFPLQARRPALPNSSLNPAMLSLTQPVSSFIGVVPKKDQHNQTYIIEGDVQLSGGLASTGREGELSLTRIYKGQVQERGKVWLQQAKYSILVKDLKGYLKLELFNRQGEVIGYAEKDLFSVKNLSYNKMKITHLKLKVKPRPTAIAARIYSGDRFGTEKQAVDKAQFVFNGRPDLDQNVSGYQYFDNKLLKGSINVAQVSKSSFYPSLSILNYGFEKEVLLFPRPLIRAFLNIIGLKFKPDTANGIIWGKIKIDNKAAENVSVELAGTSGVQATYFSYYIPDNKRSRTDSSGLFAFAGVEPGIQLVRAQYEGENLPAELVPTSNGHVSYIEIKKHPQSSVGVLSYDAFRPDAVFKTIFNIVGTDTDVELNSAQNYNLSMPRGEGLYLIESDSGADYELTRYLVDKNSYNLQLSQIESSWLQKLVGQNKINLNPYSAVVVGFFKRSDYKISLQDIEGDTKEVKIIYFNEQGRQVSSTQRPSGFVLFNVPLGYRNLEFIDKDSGLSQDHLILSDSRFVQVVSDD